jgi:probable F420-dependent oxidoreductase
MQLGFTLPQCGDAATPDNLRGVALEAEALGYDSLWVLDRLLYPVAPRAPYPATADGSLPRMAQRVLDPLTTLTFVAACTHRIALGTSVLILPLYNPVLLARQLTTLDVLSAGRLRLAFGTGWSPDEYEAAGVDFKTRGARADEALEVLRKTWSEDTPEHRGVHYTLPRSVTRLRPVQTPHPPIYMAAYTEATMKRVAERTDGWNPAGIPIPAMKTMFAAIRAMAQAAGRDPAKLRMVVRANLHLGEPDARPQRPPFTGSWQQIGADIAATRDIGAHEILFEGQMLPSFQGLAGTIELMRRLRDLVG